MLLLCQAVPAGDRARAATVPACLPSCRASPAECRRPPLLRHCEAARIEDIGAKIGPGVKMCLVCARRGYI